MKVKEKSEKAGLKFSVQKLRSWYLVPSLHGKLKGKKWSNDRFYFWGGSKITVNRDCSHDIEKTLAPWKESYDKPRQGIKKQRHHFADKGPAEAEAPILRPSDTKSQLIGKDPA